jgi:ACS family hexuronate transporter-like MFS transporter
MPRPLWLVAWRWLLIRQNSPARLDAEREMLAIDREDAESAGHSRLRWRDLLSLPQTWGVIVAKTFTDPVWFSLPTGFPSIWSPKASTCEAACSQCGSLYRRGSG